MDPHATAHAGKFAKSRLHQITMGTAHTWIARVGRNCYICTKARHFPLITETDPKPSTRQFVTTILNYRTALKKQSDKMGQPSFQASNAIIYLTYGAFLWVAACILLRTKTATNQQS